MTALSEPISTLNSDLAAPQIVPGGPGQTDAWTRTVRGLIGLAIVLAGLGLAGWLLDVPVLYNLGNPQAQMQINTTVMLLLAGLGVWQQTNPRPSALIASLLAVSVLLIGSLSLAEFVFGVDLGIDQLLMEDRTRGSHVAPPGRMSIITALCGSLLGLGLGLFTFRAWSVGQWLVVVVALFGYGSLLGHVFGVGGYYSFGQYSAIAIQTSLALSLLGSALLLVRPDVGLMRTVVSDAPGGQMARRSGLYILLAPPLLAVLSSVLVNRAGFSATTAGGLLVLVFIVGTLLLLYRVSYRLNASHEQLLAELVNRQRADQDRLAQAGLLRNVVDNTQVGIGLMAAVRDATGTVVDFRWEITNEANARITNLPVATMLGTRMTDLLPGTVETGFLATCVRVVDTGEPLSYEFPYFNDGIAGWFDITIVRQGDGVLFSSLDITARKRAEIDVQAQAELLQTIVNTSPAGIILYKPVREPNPDASDEGRIIDFEVVLANTTGAQIVGRQEPDAFVGRRMSDLLPSEDGRLFFEQVAGVIRTGEPRKWLLPYFADGINGWFNMSMIRQDGQAVVTFLDVTDLKQMQEKLERQNHDLQRANDYLQQFAYIASHDLQEPLRKIQTFGDMVATSYAPVLDETGLDMLRRMRASARRMSLIVKELLAYSRLSTRPEPFAPVPLSAVLTGVVDELTPVIRDTGAEIVLEPLPTVTGDGRQLHQLFRNLLDNALKFRQPNIPPRVRVSNRRVEARTLPSDAGIPTNIYDAFYEISVSDNGIGFDEKYADRIFQIFQRLHGRTQYDGLGVGLAICKKVAENHAGSLVASGRPGAGATLRLYLPVTINRPD